MSSDGLLINSVGGGRGGAGATSIAVSYSSLRQPPPWVVQLYNKEMGLHHAITGNNGHPLSSDTNLLLFLKALHCEVSPVNGAPHNSQDNGPGHTQYPTAV